MLGLSSLTLQRNTLLELTENARILVRKTCRDVAELYRAGRTDTVEKPDGSPLTEADRLAHRLLSDGLSALAAGLPVVSEEDAAPTQADSPHYWLIDPIDGTREFIARNDEFSVNAALISGGAPIWGCIGAPATGKLYEGGQKLGSRLWEGMKPQTLRGSSGSRSQCRVLVSRSHPDRATETMLRQLEQQFDSVIRRALGSSLKFCALAEGGADLYARLSGLYPWDMAAGQAVLEGAGGCLSPLGTEPLRYSSSDRRPLPAFVACADAGADLTTAVRKAAGAG